MVRLEVADEFPRVAGEGCAGFPAVEHTREFLGCGSRPRLRNNLRVLVEGI